MSKKNNALTVFELAVSACIIFVLAGIFGIYVNRTLGSANKVALRNELINIRMALEYYRIVNGRFPDELKELFKKDLTFGREKSSIKKEYFLEPFRIDESGFLLDPFMNRYIYDRQNGWVYSRASGCQNW